MSSYYFIVTLCSHTAAIPAILGLMRRRTVPAAYYPFLIVLMLGWLNEIASTILILYKKSNAANSNLYVLPEFLAILLLFRNWGTSRRRFVVYKILAVAVASIWILDNLVVHKMTAANDFYRLAYSIVLVFLSIDQINHVVIIEKGDILRNAKFMICGGILLYYTSRVLVQSFLVFAPGLSMEFYSRLLFVFVAVNVVTNGIYAIAILWMPRKQDYLVRY